MRNDDDETTVKPSAQLEPRVAALEVGLDRLTADVKDLANVVRVQGQTVEQEIQKLVVAVTQAQAPRRTDWGTIIAGIALLLAIGSAVFWPLNQKSDFMMQSIATLQQQFNDHQKLDMHPVGAALLQRLEGQLRDHIDSNAKQMDALRTEFQKEIKAESATCTQQFTAIREKYDMWMDKLSDHVVKLQEHNEKIEDENRAELNQWREKAMGLSSPDKTTVLAPKDAQK